MKDDNITFTDSNSLAAGRSLNFLAVISRAFGYHADPE